jgi:hypothetical protein
MVVGAGWSVVVDPALRSCGVEIAIEFERAGVLLLIRMVGFVLL